MSIENAIARNSAENNARYHKERIIPFAEEQRALTEKWIIPYAEMIISDVEDLRRRADKVLQKDPTIRRSKNKREELKYPIGFCREIAGEVFESMKKEMQNRSYPGLQALKNFVREGGLLHPFWGIDSDLYFQNAIQMGSALLDVANDTVDRSKPPVVFYPDQREAPLRSMDSFSDYADIAGRYWGYDIYPNIYMPYFTPLYPMIAVVPSKWRGTNLNTDALVLDDVGNLLFKNMTTVRHEHMFGLSYDFLFKSKYSEKRLPTDMIENLFNSKSLAHLDRIRSDIFKISTDPEDARERLAHFHIVPGQGIPKDHLDEIHKIHDTRNIFPRGMIASVRR